MQLKETQLSNKIKWVSFFRVIIAFLALFLVIFWKSKIEFAPDPGIFYRLLGLVFIFSLFYGFLINVLKNLRPLAFVQVALDFVVIFIIISFTGGIDSPFIFFYVFPILEGVMFFGKHAVYVALSIDIISLGVNFIMQYMRIYPFNSLMYSRAVYSSYDFYYSFSIFSLGFLVLGLLIGYLNSETAIMKESLEKSEAKLYDLEALRSAMIEGINSGLIVLTDDQEVTFINPIATEIVRKIDPADIGNGIRKIFGNEFSDPAGKNSVQRFQKKVIGSSGDALWLGYSIVPLTDKTGHHIGSLINFQDVTVIKDMEEKLRISDKFAFWANLSAVIAHEIRNPLASLKGSIEYLDENVTIDQENRKIFAIVKREIERLNKVINDFLYYAKLSSGTKSKIYLKNLLEEIWFELTFSLDNKGDYSFVYNGDESSVILGDPNQIRQVFMNLLLNSIEVMREKRNGGKIAVSAEQSGDEVAVDVEDEGGGLDEKVMDKVFDPFFSTKKNGTGLGLAIVYKIMQEHGGRVSVRNSERGAVFTLRFRTWQEI